MSILHKITTCCLMILPLIAFGQERIMVIADPHVWAQSLIERGEALDQMMAGQRKMIDISETLWKAAVDTATKYRPALVLIPGDLTKDGEMASHEVVISFLQRLQKAGIPSLVIPGNHDVANTDEDVWDVLYSYMDGNIVAKDPHSHSFVSEPLEGVTVLGIDGSHGKAGTGSLSGQTLKWVLHEADRAVAKGHSIIAMSHWQILEHFDKQGTLESACRMNDADALRDSLMLHGVHLVLTGHFHVNGITTYHDSITNDSLVEITTGSLITYPCSYRWLTISEDRSRMQVETDYITSTDSIADMHAYSRAWMSEHTANMIPQLTLRAWNKAESNMSLGESFIGKSTMKVLMSCIPETDSDKVALTQKYLGSTIVDLYLLHSDANEPEYAYADSLAQAFYTGLEGMIREMTDEKMNNPVYSSVQDFLITLALRIAEEPIQSLVEDVTGWRSEGYANRTDDLHLTLTINSPQDRVLDSVYEKSGSVKYVRDGQVFIERNGVLYSPDGRTIPFP